MSGRVAERRQRTVDEIVAVALDVMAESGAAGLSLGEIAKRMGIQTPSLYGYFPSKADLCDELFRRGWTELLETMRPSYDRKTPATRTGLQRQMVRTFRTFVEWSLDHRAAAELMFWRPIAGWNPGPDAYAPAMALMASLRQSVARMQADGALRNDVETDEITDVLVLQSVGVITQQLANEPGVTIASARFAKRIGALVSAFLALYAATEQE